MLVALVTHIQALSYSKLEHSGAVCCVCNSSMINMLAQEQWTKPALIYPMMFLVRSSRAQTKLQTGQPEILI